MDSISERAKLIAKQFRYSWSYLTFVLIFVIVLWTFQLALIVRFQTFWPSGRTICFSGEEDSDGREAHTNYVQNSHYYSRYADHHYKIVCYYILDSNFTSDQAKILNINPFLCSHINVGFAQVLNGTLAPRDEGDIEAYKDLMNLKIINPHIKIVLSLQDNSSSPGELPKVVSSDKLRKSFAENSFNFLKKYKFDGLDIDWEFPSWPTSDPVQKHNFTLFLKELHTSFKNNASSNLTLSVAVGAPAAIFLQCYEIADMAEYVDWINLMSYDYHLYSKLTPTTGPNAPLYQRPQDSTFLATLNTNWSVAHWVFWGMPREKIIVGIPTYGHSFKLLNSDNTAWYAPAIGIGDLGIVGYTTYPDACSFISLDSATHVWDDHYRVPYAYLGSEWISYEDMESVRHKAQLVMKGGFGGAMIFSLNTDDGKGLCRQGSYPLTSVVYSTFKQSTKPPYE